MRRVLAALLLAPPAAAQIRSVTLIPPARDFGILVGDALTIQAVIETEPGATLDRRTLPAPGPVSPTADLIAAAATQTGSRATVTLTYRNFLVPEQVTQAEIPVTTVGFTAAGRPLTARVPGWTYTASPFRHDLQPTTDPAAIRPDHRPAPPDNTAAAAILTGAALTLLGALTLAGFALPGRQPPPFAAAARRLASRTLATPDALRTLHRAFDATAGRPVLAEDLSGFLAQHPHLAPLRPAIEQIFAASHATFYGGPPAAPPPLPALSRALARAERRA